MITSDLPRPPAGVPHETCDHPTTRIECSTPAVYQVDMNDGTTFRVCASHRLDILIVSGMIGEDRGSWTR